MNYATQFVAVTGRIKSASPQKIIFLPTQGHWASAHWTKSFKSFNQRLGPYCEESNTMGIFFVLYFMHVEA